MNALTAKLRAVRRRRLIRASDREPHLVLEFDIATGLFTVTMTGLDQETMAVKTLDVILGDTTGKAGLFVAAVRGRMWRGR